MYTAGWNTPGYLPDTAEELSTFDTASEAWAYLRDEYIYQAAPDDPDPDTVADFDTAVRSGMAGTVITPTPTGYVAFFVAEVEEW